MAVSTIRAGCARRMRSGAPRDPGRTLDGYGTRPSGASPGVEVITLNPGSKRTAGPPPRPSPTSCVGEGEGKSFGGTTPPPASPVVRALPRQATLDFHLQREAEERADDDDEPQHAQVLERGLHGHGADDVADDEELQPQQDAAPQVAPVGLVRRRERALAPPVAKQQHRRDDGSEHQHRHAAHLDRRPDVPDHGVQRLRPLRHVLYHPPLRIPGPGPFANPASLPGNDGAAPTSTSSTGDPVSPPPGFWGGGRDESSEWGRRAKIRSRR